MSQHTTHVPDAAHSGPWGRDEALQLAWTTWLVILATPFVALPFALHMTPSAGGSGPKQELAETWFFIVMIYLLVALPVALLIRAYLFRSFWRARAVLPRAYYIGMFIVWSALAVAGLTAELVCVATATLVPNILPGLLSLFVYLLLWPTGTAMEPRGAGRNPEIDQEPR
jgi:hypothetical protein